MSVAGILPITGPSMVGDQAISNEGQILRKLLASVFEFSGSFTVGEPKRVAREALVAAYIAAQFENLNGESSTKVEPSTYRYAQQFLQLLPSTIPPPEITADADGEIMLDWDQGRRNVLTVSIGRDGTITYAGLFGYNTTHGTETLGDALPPVISSCFERLFAPAAI
jgi:hypothetical protein